MTATSRDEITGPNVAIHAGAGGSSRTSVPEITGPSAVENTAAAEHRPARTLIRPYGDTTGDGMVQLSFTLPLPAGKRAEGVALQLAGTMGMEAATVVHQKGMGPDFTFVIVYGRVTHLLDVSAVEVVEREYPLRSAKEVNLAIRTTLRRRLVVLGACVGTDAHTVGIDAILNVKGFAGEKGLEYYREIAVVNLGAQVPIEELVARAREEAADAILVSQVVTQRNAHLHNTKQLSAAFHAAFPVGGRPLLIVGGPRFDTVTADELGVDRIFGRGTTPGEVASYLVHALVAPLAAGSAAGSAAGRAGGGASGAAGPAGPAGRGGGGSRRNGRRRDG